MRVPTVGSPGGVYLAPLTADNVTSEYVSWLNDEEVVRYTEVRGKQDLAAAREYVRTANETDNSAIWRIMSDDDVHVGNIRLSNIRFLHQRAEVALLIGARNYWGKGIGTSAIELASRFGFDELQLHKLTAGIMAQNIGSRIAFERAGYHCEATFRDHAVFEGEFCDTLAMAKFNTSGGNG